MTQPLRVVYAWRSGSESMRVHTPGRTLPVIVVPDLMGTRLTDPESDKLVWNPKGAPFGDDPTGFKVDLERLSQMSAELVPDETHPYPEVSRNRALPRVKHGRSMLLHMYRELFVQLENHASSTAFHDLGVTITPYFCGYDWRQDNARSALRLSEMVEEALAECSERTVVLIGHGMGGQICRYYCRALGGESKVHQLFLIGTPLLGAPAAFAALKHGLEGIYPREITDAARAGEWGGVVFECANVLGNLVSAAGATGAPGVAGSLFGDLYLLLCLSAGRWLSRDQTRTFVRQMPSVYQLMPGALYCKEHLHWVAFDPLATGIAPTGYMVPMPSVFEQHLSATAALLDVASGGQQLGTEMQASVRRYMEGPSEGRLSSRASRNAMPFLELMSRSLEIMSTGGWRMSQVNWYASDSGAELGQFGSALEPLGARIMALVPAFKGFAAQVPRTFIDCRNPQSLYEDPYTGLLDAVDERPLCASRLPLSYRFDEVLTVTPRVEKAVSMAEVLMGLGRALGGGLMSMVYGLGDAVIGGIGTYHASQVRAQQGDQAHQDRLVRERIHPRAYLPPNAYAIYSQSEQTNPGCLLQPLAFVSNDDSNVVRTAYLPNILAQLSADTSRGDGSVPQPSAFPEQRLLSRPFKNQVDVPSTRHAGLPGATQCTNHIGEMLDDKLADFLAS